MSDRSPSSSLPLQHTRRLQRRAGNTSPGSSGSVPLFIGNAPSPATSSAYDGPLGTGDAVTLVEASAEPPVPASSALRPIIRLLDQLEGNELDELMRCCTLQARYQIRPIVTMRIHGQRRQAVGRPLIPAVIADSQPPPDLEERPTKRARIQSRERITDMPDQEDSGDGEDTEEEVRGSILRPERPLSGISEQGGASTAVPDAGDEVLLVPSTAIQRANPMPHMWIEQGGQTTSPMELLRQNHPSVHRHLHQSLASHGGRTEELGNRICIFADVLASAHSVKEVAEDLQLALRYQLGKKGREGPAFSQGIASLPNNATSEQRPSFSGLGRELIHIPSSQPADLLQQLRQLMSHHQLPELYQRIQTLDASRYTSGLLRRLHLANLAQAFEHELKEVSSSSVAIRGPWNKARVSQAKDRLFARVIKDADRRSPDWAAEARRFERRLDRGRRWWSLAQRFGWGVLVMIPADFPESRWERELGSEKQVGIFFDYLAERYPGWFHPEHTLAILVAMVSDVALSNTPADKEEFRAWIAGDG